MFIQKIAFVLQKRISMIEVPVSCTDDRMSKLELKILAFKGVSIQKCTNKVQ
jgi:hypothetical protein